jgi:uncharacterized delta-60 repeat protein
VLASTWPSKPIDDDHYVAEVFSRRLGRAWPHSTMTIVGLVLVIGGVGCAQTAETGARRHDDPTGSPATSGSTVIRAAGHAGELDPSFGTKGTVTSTGDGADIVVQRDGKLVVAGSSGEDPPSIEVKRFLADGTPDNGFGQLGRAPVPMGKFASVRAVALQRDGKIVIAGQVVIEGQRRQMLVARLHVDGTLDPGFGDAGVFVSKFEAGAESVAVQSDGKVVVAGQTAGDYDPPATVPSVVLARLLPNGSLDGNFDPGGPFGAGVVVSDLAWGAVGVAFVPPTPEVPARIVVGLFRPAGRENLAAARFLMDGSLDRSFGVDGVARADHQGLATTDMVRGVDGTLLVTGIYGGMDLTGLMQIGIARFSVDGALDTGFGDSGETVTDAGYRGARAFAGAVDAGGRPLVAGRVEETEHFVFAVLRFTTTGRLDATFGRNGVVTTLFKQPDTGHVINRNAAVTAPPENFPAGDANAVAVRPDGTVVATGTVLDQTGSALALAGYLP